MKKDILLIGAIHGDEPLGPEILAKIDKNNRFDWIIGNPKALFLKKREYQKDLNRSAPGEISSEIYESRRAAEILSLSKEYKYVIDIHGSTKKTGVFIIITKPTKENFKLAALLNIKKIVYWPSFDKELEGPLSEFFNCGLEIECGPKNSKKIKKELENILLNFLDNYKKREKSSFIKQMKRKEVYQVYGSLKKKQKNIKLQEFKLTTGGTKEKFYPIFIGGYTNLVCYKTKKLNSQEIFTLFKENKNAKNN